jgi:hypothetical protein
MVNLSFWSISPNIPLFQIYYLPACPALGRDRGRQTGVTRASHSLGDKQVGNIML